MATNIISGRKPNVKLSMRDTAYNPNYKAPAVPTPVPTNTSVPVAPKTNVPVTTLETPTKPLDIPQTNVTQVDATGAVGVANTYLQEQQKALETAQTPVSESEARIKELMGLRSKEAETKKTLEDKAGINQKTDTYNKIISNIQRQTAGIQESDDNAFYGVEEARLDASGKDITKGVFGAREQQMNLQNAIARRAKVSDLQGSLASASVLQGDLESARQQITDSLAAIYDPIKQDIQDEMFFLQRADTRFNSAQKEQSDAKKLVLQAQMDAITNAEKLVSDAVASGVATPEDVKKMQALSGDPKAQSAYAQSILVRGASEAYQLDKRIKMAQLAKATAVDTSVPTQIIDNNGSKQLVNTQTGEVIKDFGTANTPTLQLAQNEGNIAQISSLLSNPDLSSAVGPNSFARMSVTNAFTGGKDNVIAGVQQLSSQLSLDSLVRAKASGATFGALSDTELQILTSSASKLGTWAIKDKANNVIGYKASEKDFKQELDKINNYAKLDYILKGGLPESVGVQRLSDGTYWTTNSDGSYTQLQ